MTSPPSAETGVSKARPMPAQPGETPATEAASGSGRQDLLLLILLGGLWGTAFPVIRVGILAGAPPLVFAAVRYALTAGCLVPIALVLRARVPPRSQLIPAAIFGGVFIIGLYGGLLYIGEQSTSGGLAAVLAASASFWSVLFGYAILPGERFGREEMIGLVVGFVGVGVLVLPELGTGPTTTLVGSIFVLVAVVSFAAGGVLLRRTVPAEPTLWTLTTQFAVAAALVGAIAISVGEPRALGNASATLPTLAYLVVFPSILGYVLYFRLHHRVGPSRANLVVYVGPVVAVIVGFVLFGEKVTPIEIGGMALIVVGLYIVQRGRLTKKG
jgi:probable blue pigment (indigoidine) exporter